MGRPETAGRGEWQDTTSHSRNSTDRTPRQWELHVAGVRLSVHRHIHYGSDVWLLSVRGMIEFGPHELQARGDGRGQDVCAAQREAVVVVSEMLARIQSALQEVE